MKCENVGKLWRKRRNGWERIHRTDRRAERMCEKWFTWQIGEQKECVRSESRNRKPYTLISRSSNIFDVYQKWWNSIFRYSVDTFFYPFICITPIYEDIKEYLLMSIPYLDWSIVLVHQVSSFYYFQLSSVILCQFSSLSIFSFSFTDSSLFTASCFPIGSLEELLLLPFPQFFVFFPFRYLSISLSSFSYGIMSLANILSYLPLCDLTGNQVSLHSISSWHFSNKESLLSSFPPQFSIRSSHSKPAFPNFPSLANQKMKK